VRQRFGDRRHRFGVKFVVLWIELHSVTAAARRCR
jgi:hypothetical protein